MSILLAIIVGTSLVVWLGVTLWHASHRRTVDLGCMSQRWVLEYRDGADRWRL